MEMEGGERASDGYGLTSKELKILEALAEGKTREEIADRLSISIHTVDRHLTTVYVKLGVRNGSQAVAKRLRSLLPPELPNAFC